MKTFLGWLLVIGTALPCGAQDAAPASFVDALQRATKQAVQKQRFELRYQFPPDSKFRWNVEHVSTNKTTMAEASEVMSSRSQSTTVWKVIHIDSLGQATLEQTIERANMWQRNGEQEPVSYDSASGATPPKEFQALAHSIGKPLTTLLVDASGKTIAGDSEKSQYRFGTGGPFVPFPKEPIAVGDLWYAPDEVVAYNEDKSIKRIKLRMRYELADVKDHRAIIRFSTEILTPIDDPRIRAQISQRITRGEIEFDLARGLMVRKKVNWNEKVQGFHGPNSLLHYLGEYTVTYAEPAAVTATAPVTTLKPLKIRTRDDGPVFRR